MHTLEAYKKLKAAGYDNAVAWLEIGGETFPAPTLSELEESCQPYLHVVQANAGIPQFKYAFGYKDGQWYVGSGLSDYDALLQLWFALFYPEGLDEKFESIRDAALSSK